MLKGQTYDEQLFQSDSFRLITDTFLNSNSGIIKGCELSNTTTSVTIGDGFFIIKGGLLQEYGGDTLTPESDGYYYLVCEIDLSKTNTELAFNQGSIKLVMGASAYPTLTQQDILGSGTVYQYPFAKFIVSSGVITGFTDLRTFLDFDSIYDNIENVTQALIDTIQENLDEVLDESIYVPKSLLGDAYDSSSTYTKYDYCIYNNKLYRAKRDINSPESFTSSHWEETTISNELKDVYGMKIFNDGIDVTTAGGKRVIGQFLIIKINGIVTINGHIDPWSNITSEDTFTVNFPSWAKSNQATVYAEVHSKNDYGKYCTMELSTEGNNPEFKIKASDDESFYFNISYYSAD